MAVSKGWRPAWFLPFFIIFLSGCALLIRSPINTDYKKSESPPGLYRGIFHVHSDHSHDSGASLEQIMNTAQDAGLDFVIVTDHNSIGGLKAFDQTSHPSKPLLIFGDEISAPDGHLIALGIRQHPPELPTSQAYIDWIHEEGGYAILAHPVCIRNPWKNWNVRNVDGMEIYNFAHSMYPENKIALATKASILTPKNFLRSLQKTPEKSLNKWKSEMKRTPLVAFGATDAHIHLQWAGLTPENFLLAFQSVTMYVHAEANTPEHIIHAVGQGKSFIAFEAQGTAQRFVFSAVSSHSRFHAGDTVRVETPVILFVRSPEVGEIRLLRDGEIVNQVTGTELSIEAPGPGRYHVEIYKNGKLWVLANPIYLYA